MDGYNLLHTDQKLAALAETKLEEARNKLLRQVALYASKKAVRITMVFDGRAGMGPDTRTGSTAVKVLYSASPESADDLISRIVEKDTKVWQMTVVSSDNRVANRARLAGARALLSSEFMARIKKVKGRKNTEQEKPEGLSEEELKDWLKTFGKGEGEKG